MLQTQFSDGTQYLFGAVAAILLIIAFVPYLRSVIKRTITPRPLTWIGWTLLMGISFLAQVFAKGFALNQIAMVMSISGCLVISIFSFKNGNIKPVDWICLLLGIACGIIYVTTKNAWLTTVLAVAADILVAIPTLHNAWKDPLSEKSSAWTFGAIAYFITVIACRGHDILYAVFPIYLFCFNSTMILLTSRKISN